jgi:hypothetical protein
MAVVPPVAIRASSTANGKQHTAGECGGEN